MQTDFTRAKNQYDTSRQFLNQAAQPIQGANALTSLGKILQAYFASKGMRQGENMMGQAETEQKNARRLAMARALGAGREDTPFEADLFPGEEPIKGLYNKGTGNNVNALAQSLMGSEFEDLQNVGMGAMLTQPKDNRTSLQKEYEAAKSGGYQGSFFDYQKALKAAGKSDININTGEFKMPSGHMANPDYDPNQPVGPNNAPVMPIPGSTTEKTYTKKTEGQTKSATFATRMARAEQNFQQLESTGYDPSNMTDSIANKTGTLGNFLKSSEGRRYYNAASDWVRAKLRKESGAVIGPQEMADEIILYFPVPGDDAAAIEQKRIARMIATNGMIDESQGAYKGAKYEIPELQEISIPTITTQDEYDNLPSGASFFEDGVKYRKP